jgi:hypothetical protein
MIHTHSHAEKAPHDGFEKQSKKIKPLISGAG